MSIFETVGYVIVIFWACIGASVTIACAARGVREYRRELMKGERSLERVGVR